MSWFLNMVNIPLIALGGTVCLGNCCENRFLTWTQHYLCLTDWFQIHVVHFLQPRQWTAGNTQEERKRGLEMQITWCKKINVHNLRTLTSQSIKTIFLWNNQTAWATIKLLCDPLPTFFVHYSELLHRSVTVHHGIIKNWDVQILKKYFLWNRILVVQMWFKFQA